MADDHTVQSQAGAPGRLLIVVDETPSGQHTAAIGAAIAAAMGAEAIFHVAIPIERLEAGSPAEIVAAASAHQAECRARVEPLFAAVRQLARGAGVRCETVLTIDEAPVEAARRIATEQHCLMIVAGSRGRGALARMLGGSLVDQLVQSAACPVVVCREDTAFGPVPPMAAA
jgi:nucleotide-binding universal stress UspA family protein